MGGDIVTYRIKDWDRHFETSESRKRKSPLAWIGVPTKHDGRGFNRLKRHPDWAAVYGAWVLIIAVSAKCPVRGTLSDEDGAFTALDISDKVGLPEELVQRCLDLLSSHKEGIQWIEAVTTTAVTKTLAESASAPADSGRLQHIPADSAGPPASPGRSQQTPADHAGTCCDSGKSQSYITGQYITNTGAAPQQNKTEPTSARAPEASVTNFHDPTAALITLPDGTHVDYHVDPIVWQAEFIRQWNALPHVSKQNRNQLTQPNQRLLYRNLQDPDWDWEQAFKAFPVWRPGDEPAAMSWFLEEGIVNEILEGRHRIRTRVTAPAQTIPDAFSFTEEELNSS